MAAHRYWRVYITATNGNSYTSLTEIILATSIGGANVATGGTASSSSTAFGWVAANAFDGSTAEPGWHSDGSAMPQWVAYDFGAGNAQDVAEFGITSRNAGDAATQMAKDFRLQYSDDGATWSDKYAVTLQTGWGGYETRKYSSSGNQIITKKRWRLNISANESGNPAISELVLRGVVGGANLATGGIASASTFFASSPTYAADKAFDGNAGTYWSSYGSAPQWIEYNFPVAVEIVQYVITAPPGGNQGNAPKSWTLEFLSNTGSWVVADTRTLEANWSAGESRTYMNTSAAVAARPQVFVCT